MIRIRIETKLPTEMRYDTAGDYYQKNDRLHLEIARQEEEDYEFLIAIHELIEWYLAKKAGIKEFDITAHDVQFEKNRKAGVHGPHDEPGDAYNAPYRRQHRFAENIERLIAQELGVDWDSYNSRIITESNYNGGVEG